MVDNKDDKPCLHVPYDLSLGLVKSAASSRPTPP